MIRYADGGNPEYETNYFLRIRTRLDKDGNVINGLYGKIHGEISLGNYAWLHMGVFDYYLNPNEGDTNIEFDTKNNLFKNLTEYQKVADP